MACSCQWCDFWVSMGWDFERPMFCSGPLGAEKPPARDRIHQLRPRGLCPASVVGNFELGEYDAISKKNRGKIPLLTRYRLHGAKC